mmetsp:Transcript_31140/g.70077  ORF Transcript_31140/g.70077 Transcript_31140/m.70077 type:complete len:219 (+) Transcript_31140:945-1601(+)
MESNFRSIVTQRSVGVQLSKALDHDSSVLRHIMDSIPVLQLDFIDHIGIWRDFTRETMVSKSIVRSAGDQSVATLLHLLTDGPLNSRWKRRGGRSQLDQLEVVADSERLTFISSFVLDDHLVVTVRMPPSSSFLVERLQEHASIIGDLALVPPQELDLKDQRGVPRNLVAAAFSTVTIITSNGEHRLLASLHGGNTFVPAFDDLSLTELEGERRVSIP